eukprot:gene10108-11143_t
MGDTQKMKRVCFVQPAGFTSSGANLWNVASSHQATKNHTANFTDYMLLGNVDVASALDEARQREIDRHNRNASRYSVMMKHHINVATYLAAQGLAFRAHSETKDSANRGNFLELMDVLGEYSYELRTFLDKERITYTSHQPQNQLIESIFEEVRNEIFNRVTKSRFVSVMMDDTSDLSNTEQSAISVRLIHNGNIEEHLLGLVDASEDQSADGLTNLLLKTLEQYKILPAVSEKKLIGQSYDGAPTMSGEFNGVQKKVRDIFPYAYYNHCVAHRMSLCAAQSANKILEVAKFFGTLDKIISFFRSSPKRTRHLGYNLPKPGDTRWLSRDLAVSAIDSHYEAIGTVLNEISTNGTEKIDTQTTARGLVTNIQNVDFICLLKLYRKIFEHCTPIMKMMQKPSLDAVQLRTMLDDFLHFLTVLDFDQIWANTLEADPNFPVARGRGGWRNNGQENNGSQEDWKQKLCGVAVRICVEFSEQIAWRFENLEKFNWMDLIHPSKIATRRKATSRENRALITECQSLYPFAISDVTSVEHNLDVLYHNTAISILLQKLIKERDEALKRKMARRAAKRRRMHGDEDDGRSQQEMVSVDDEDQFEPRDDANVDEDCVNEGEASVQDLLTVIHNAGLADALPQVMILLEIAAVNPLTSVHCERVFSRMKRVISSSRSRMLQTRKEHLVLLQVEHSLLRWLVKQPSFYENIVTRFKGINQKRFQRFSRK